MQRQRTCPSCQSTPWKCCARALLYSHSMSCRAIDNEGAYELVEVTGERVDSLVRENTLLIKLDVEGFEPTAFRSSSGLLEQYRYDSLQQHTYSTTETSWKPAPLHAGAPCSSQTCQYTCTYIFSSWRTSFAHQPALLLICGGPRPDIRAFVQG